MLLFVDHSNAHFRVNKIALALRNELQRIQWARTYANRKANLRESMPEQLDRSANGDESGLFSMMADAQGVWHMECTNDI